jgi:signal transduction histidine kinase
MRSSGELLLVNGRPSVGLAERRVVAPSGRSRHPRGRSRLVAAEEAAGPLLEYGALVDRVVSLARRRLFDAAIVLGALGGVLEFVLRRDAPAVSLWFAVPVEALLTLTLLARRQFPFAAPAGIFLAASAFSFVDGRVVGFTANGFFAALAASFLLGILADQRQALAGLAIVVAAVGIVVANDPEGRFLPDFASTSVLFAGVWLVAYVLGRSLAQTRAAKDRARRAEHERAAEAQRAVEEERQRIARELHDVVAHSVSVMTVQAGAVRRLLTADQEREREALLTVEETGRTALAEMRRLLGMLRGANESPSLAPQPGMSTLGILVEQIRDAGLPVEYRIEGEPVELPPGIDLSAYRIVQEALTNALRHAGPARARVSVRYRPSRLELEIENDGRSEANGTGEGQGLVGMEQRVALFGGQLTAGPRAGAEGYRVKATLPLTEEGRA